MVIQSCLNFPIRSLHSIRVKSLTCICQDLANLGRTGYAHVNFQQILTAAKPLKKRATSLINPPPANQCSVLKKLFSENPIKQNELSISVQFEDGVFFWFRWRSQFTKSLTSQIIIECSCACYENCNLNDFLNDFLT